METSVTLPPYGISKILICDRTKLRARQIPPVTMQRILSLFDDDILGDDFDIKKPP